MRPTPPTAPWAVPPDGPLQHHRSGRSVSTDFNPDGALGASPLRPTTSSTAGGRKSDAEHRSMQRSARLKVCSPLQAHRSRHGCHHKAGYLWCRAGKRALLGMA